jgi:hypothetical protein
VASKGLVTEDILDSFLACWNTIEIIAGKYHANDAEAKKIKASGVGLF